VKPVSAAKAHKAAKACGMTAEQWQQARGQASDAQSRGRRAPKTKVDLDTWGDCEGQQDLFSTEGN
jgi:hypothetical protein